MQETKDLATQEGPNFKDMMAESKSSSKRLKGVKLRGNKISMNPAKNLVDIMM